MTGNQLLGAGLESVTGSSEFRNAMDGVCEAAFAAVFLAQDEGRLQWRRCGEDLEDLSAEVVVKNGRGEEITVPAILSVSISEYGSRVGFLVLGSRYHAPCRNTADPRVQRLWTQVTGRQWLHFA